MARNYKAKVKRTREQIAQAREDLVRKTESEIDAIVSEYHAKLSRQEADSIGAAYLRYSSRFQDSIADQLRVIFEAASKAGIFIPRENIFYDMGVSGKKERRSGFNLLKDAIENKTFDVLLMFATSRLYRKSYKSMKFVEEELVERGLRAIFVKSRLDTADGDNWKMMFQYFTMLDEIYASIYKSGIQAAHESLFLQGMVCTSLSLGYTGQDVPGEFTKQNRPRQKIIIDPETAPWIKKIFDWYLAGKSMDQIAQKLNDDPDAPAPENSLTGMWTHVLVRRHLMHPAYRGFWCYGDKETEWLSKKDYAKQKKRDEPLQSKQFEYLRIVSDEQWYRVQEILANEKKKSGCKPKDGDRQSRPRLLRQLFCCPEHGRKLVVSGPYGRSLLCLLCRATKAEDRPLYTHLNRQLALKLTCDKFLELIKSDAELVHKIISACQQAAELIQRPDPERLAQLRSELQKLMSKIDFNRRNPGESDDEQRQTELLLKELRGQHATAAAELSALESAQEMGVAVPTVEEVTSLLDELSQTIVASTLAESEDDMRIARRIIDELTGGQIDLYQMGERRQNKGWLQGRFHVDVISMVSKELTGVSLSKDLENGVEVVIDYKAVNTSLDSEADQAKALYDEGLLCKVIAEQMGRSRSYITKLIQHWYQSHGQIAPDGRKRRASLDDKQISTPFYKQLADPAVQLMEEGISYLEIARRLKTNDTEVAKAIAWWHKSKNLPVPTAKDRRHKTLLQAKALYEQGVLIKDMAADLNYSPRGLTLALKNYYAESGQTMTDGRARRGNAKSGQRINGKA